MHPWNCTGKDSAPEVEGDADEEDEENGKEERAFNVGTDSGDDKAAGVESLDLQKEKELLRDVVSQLGGEADHNGKVCPHTMVDFACAIKIFT